MSGITKDLINDFESIKMNIIIQFEDSKITGMEMPI